MHIANPRRLERKDEGGLSLAAEVKKVVDPLMTGFEEFKKTNDQRLAEIEKKGAADPLTLAKLGKIEADLARTEEVNQKLVAIEREATYLDIGRLVLGKLWQPSVNFDVGGTPVAFDPRDAVVETDYGFTFTDRRTRSAPRLFSLQITAAKGIEVLQGLQEIQRLAGSAGDVICCVDPGDTANFHLLSMQGRFTKGGA